MPEGLTIAGVNVSTLALRVVDLSGLLAVPERKGAHIDVPGRHGAVRVPRKKYRARDVALEFWIRGARPDGTVPDPSVDAQRGQFYANLHTESFR